MVVEAAKAPTKVFISYSWDSPEHQELVRNLADKLRKKVGVDADIDVYVEAEPPFTPEQGDWDLWMEGKIEWAEFVLIVCTETYNRRFQREEEPGLGLGVSFEGTIIRQELYKAHKDTKFIPVVLSYSDRNHVLPRLGLKSIYVIDNEQSFAKLCARLRKQPTVVKPEIGNPPTDFSANDLQVPLPSFSNYDQQTWAGRDALVSDLLPKLQGQICLLWLTGISGIGKTALGECLASQAWKSNPSFQWIYLEILEGQSPDFASIAADLLGKLGESNIAPQELNNPEQLAKRLLQKLQSHPYWIQLDALERLLDPEQPTEFVDVYWTTFLQRCLTESNLISRLVLTAQALPAALIEFGDRYNTWTKIRLDGLSSADQRLEFFAKRGVIVEDSNREILTRIADIYEGHPLVLKVIAEDILKESTGDILNYWRENQREFEQVARELQNVRLDETEYNETLDRRVRERIRKSLEQLPVDALDLLCRSSVFRCPVPKTFWLGMIGDSFQDDKAKLTPRQQNAVYRVLGDRALIEKEYPNIRQHNLIRAISYDLLKADILTWQKAERQAANQWLTAYEPTPDVSNLEKVRGQIEAFSHLCKLEDWEAAKTILLTQELGAQLHTWSYYRETIVLYRELIGHLDTSVAVACKKGLGNAYYFLSNYSYALELFQQSLDLAREIGDRQEEGRALGKLGSVYRDLSKYKQATICHQQHLEIAREMGDSYEKGIALGNLGSVYRELGYYEQAIACHRQHLEIAREMGDPRVEGNALGNLGFAYLSQRKYKQAIEYSQECLEIFHKIGNRIGEASALNNLGLAYHSQENYEQAIELYQKSFEIKQDIRDQQGQANSLGNLGAIFIKLERYQEALENLKRSLKIFREIGNRAAEAETYKHLAELHQRIGSINLAQEYCEQALALAKELDIPLAEECSKLKEELEKIREGG